MFSLFTRHDLIYDTKTAREDGKNLELVAPLEFTCSILYSRTIGDYTVSNKQIEPNKSEIDLHGTYCLVKKGNEGNVLHIQTGPRRRKRCDDDEERYKIHCTKQHKPSAHDNKQALRPLSSVLNVVMRYKASAAKNKTENIR